MADFLNNITNKIPLPNNPQESLGKFADAASQIPGNFNIPKIPNPNDALKGLEGKIDSISSKYDSLETKFKKFSSEPAGERVYTQKTINTETSAINSKYDGFKKLREHLIQKQN